MSTKSSMMGLKVTYQFDDNPTFLSRLSSSLKVKFGEMELYSNETRLIGVVKLRDCIQAVVKSSPEVLSSLASNHDFNIYVCDYSEADSPLVGYGLLSKLIENDFYELSEDEKPKPKPKDILIPGQVEPSSLNLLFNNNSKPKYTLCVKLNLKKIEKPKKQTRPKMAPMKIVKPGKVSLKSCKKLTNQTSATIAHRTFSMPVRPIEFLPPNTRITKDDNFAKELKSYTKKNPESFDRTIFERRTSYSKCADQSYLDQSSLMNAIMSKEKFEKDTMSPTSDMSSLNNMMTHNHHEVSSAPTSDISDPQLLKDSDVNYLFDFDPDNFFDFNDNNNNKPESKPLNNITKQTLTEPSSSNSDEDNGTPKDSDALTPIIESVSDKNPSQRNLATSPLYEEDGEPKLVSSPFTVYD